MLNGKKPLKVLTAKIVNDEILSDTLLMCDLNTNKRYMFETFRNEVSKTSKDEMMVAVHNDKTCEFFTEKELRAFMLKQGISECRIEYYCSKK